MLGKVWHFPLIKRITRKQQPQVHPAVVMEPWGASHTCAEGQGDSQEGPAEEHLLPSHIGGEKPGKHAIQWLRKTDAGGCSYTAYLLEHVAMLHSGGHNFSPF